MMNGKRWDLAVELLESGESVVALGDCLIAYREVAGPRMTGNIRVEILSTAASESRVQTDIHEIDALFRQAGLTRGRRGTR